MTFLKLFLCLHSVFGYEMLNNVKILNSSDSISDVVKNILPNKVIIFGGSDMGFPLLNQGSVDINNGIPQRANYSVINQTIYNTLLSQDLIEGIPSGYSDYIVFDFEEWGLLWDSLNDVYKNASIDHIQNMFPDLFPDRNNSELLYLAKQSWELSSMEVFLYAIQVTRDFVPCASIGYYGYPAMPYWGNRSDFRHTSQNNDKLIELWEQVDVLLPSIYMFYKSAGNIDIYLRNNNYVYRKIMESVRIKNNVLENTGKNLTIFPYTMFYYHEPVTGFLEYNEFLSEFNYPYQFNYLIDGIIIWEVISVTNAENVMSWFEEYSCMFENYL